MMQAIEVANGVEVGMDELVKRLSKLDVVKLEILRGHIDRVVAYKKAPSKAERESQLVKLIKQKIPSSLLKYKNDLYAKFENGTITPQEHHDLKTTKSI